MVPLVQRISAIALLMLLSLGCRRAVADDACLTNCQLRSKELGCAHPERCAENCDKAKKAVACKKPMDAFMACALKAPKERWECGRHDIPVLLHEACEHEQDDVLICLQGSDGKL